MDIYRHLRKSIEQRPYFKGLGHKMDLTFDDTYVCIDLGLSKGRPGF